MLALKLTYQASKFRIECTCPSGKWIVKITCPNVPFTCLKYIKPLQLMWKSEIRSRPSDKSCRYSTCRTNFYSSQMIGQVKFRTLPMLVKGHIDSLTLRVPNINICVHNEYILFALYIIPLWWNDRRWLKTITSYLTKSVPWLQVQGCLGMPMLPFTNMV